MSSKSQQKVFIGISSCLLGQKVRFDANHKEQRFITRELATQFEFVPVCPEMAIGLGVPRTPIHLSGDQHTQRAVNVRDESNDVTQPLVEFGRKKARELDFISGYIFKKGSPSCGLFNVKIYKSKTQVLNTGMGLYARQITENNPILPVEEEGRLKDARLRQNFLQRVEVYHRWQQLKVQGISKNALIEFHTRHKFMLLAHCETTYRSLGRKIAAVGNITHIDSFADEYITMLMAGLTKPTSRGKQSNVLEHLVGYFKKHLDKHDKSELRQLIGGYRSGALPWAVPAALLKHYLRKFPNPYLGQQYYLSQANQEI